jgi:mannose-6-phosphate isomerase-like protein (cupin superfamily)
MNYTPINFQDKLGRFTEHWSPRIVAKLNDYHLKLAKIQGEFVWHKHDDTDEAFIVLQGEMRIALHDGEVRLRAGEMFVVPRGVEHKPTAVHECSVLLIEPAGTVNTGDAGGKLTADSDVWV